MATIDILISSNGTSQEKLDSSAANGGIAPQSKSNNSATNKNSSTILKSAIVHQLVGTGVNTAKTMVQTQISLYGDRTGDYIKQTKMENTYNNIVNGTTTILGLGVAFAVNPVMGAVTAGITLLNLGIQDWQNDKRERIELNKATAIANYSSQRLGAKLVNGNRY